jgi:DnaJ-domain-containing protein 1
MSSSCWNVEPWPLLWPEQRARTPDWKRRFSPFSVTFAQARSHLLGELAKMGGRNIVISSNQPVRQDGLPLAIKSRIDDPGVAVYFMRDGEAKCLPCDEYHSVLANLRAIGKTVEAFRGIERWGAKAMLDAALEGFAALPAGGSEGWWAELGVAPTADPVVIEAAWRALVKTHHPDAGGDPARFRTIQDAYQQALSMRVLPA